MKLLIVLSMLVCIALAVLAARPQATAPGTPEATAANVTATTAGNATVVELPPPTEFPQQCHYDYKQHRISKGCNVVKPPKCSRGKLVALQIDDVFEMCCCNFSVHEDQ